MNTIIRSIIYSKRKGFGLPFGLVITIFGLFVVALMFVSVNDFFRIFADYRSGYTEYITASSCVESLKGAIVAANKTATTMVLHGTANKETNPPYRENSVTEIEGLLISEDKSFEIGKEINVNGRQWVEAKVYDASYSTVQIAPNFPNEDFDEIPPSYLYQSDNRAFFNNEGEPPSYEEVDDGNVKQSQINDHRRHGAYLIRVKIYDILPDESRRLARTTEELFRMFIDV